MIPHIHTLFEFISTPYNENQHQTLNMKKIDRGQIRFREYSITLLQLLYATATTFYNDRHLTLRATLFMKSRESAGIKLYLDFRIDFSSVFTSKM